MKNLFKKIALITVLLMGITYTSKAVTVSFILTINDYASPAWTRDYCAQVYVMEGNVQHCVQQLTGLSVGSNLISYDCDLPYSESNQNYGIYCKVWRTGNPLFNGNGSAYPLYFHEVTNGVTPVTANII